MANSNRAPWCQAVSTGPTRGCRALRPTSPQTLFQIFWSETFTPVTWWRSFCRTLAVLILFLLHKGADTGPSDGLRTFHGPVQLSLSNCLSPEISSMLLKLCWETQQTFWQWHVLMCHPGGVWPNPNSNLSGPKF